jgi:hypothetical protein
MALQEQNPKSTEEIDLTQFFKWIGKGFTGIGNGLLYALAALRNLFFENLLFFAGIIIIGLALGAIYSELLKKKYYQSTMVLSCDYLNTEILKNTIEKFNLLSMEKDGEGLAEVLVIDIATAKNIQEFEFKPFVSEDDVVEMATLREQLNNLAADKKDLVEKVMLKLEIENKNAYQISARVYDPHIVKPLEKALVNYFSKNEYIRRRMEIHRANLLSRKDKLENESRKLDSLKDIMYQNYQNLGKTSRGSGNVYLGDEKLSNPLDVFKQDLELNKEILELEEKLYVKPDFEVVDGFTTFKEPESDSLVKILIISFLISWITGYLIIGVWRFDKYLATYKATES